ncbi:MAG: succinate dehydrogenase assembly factor 2 [Rhodobacteraceae bacterium]|nr:succinate dehydrogenase assembly factor 2 [Paracoccaceae bacterium]
MDDTRTTRLRRLRLRSQRRGTREMDLILGGYANACMEDPDDADLVAYEELLAEIDQDLYAWVSGAKDAPPRHRSAIHKIRTYLSAVSFSAVNSPIIGP